MADENTAAVPQPEQDQPARARRIETGPAAVAVVVAAVSGRPEAFASA